MSSRRAIIQILCLYLGTSGIFLCIFFGSLYNKEKRHLFIDQNNNLREIAIGVYETLHTRQDDINGALHQIAEENTAALQIYNKKGVKIYDSLHIDLSQEEFEQGIARRGDKVIVEPFMHERLSKSPPQSSQDTNQVAKLRSKGTPPISKYKENLRYKIFIQDDALDKQFLFLRLKLIAYFLCSLFGVGFVAYFLVRLALRPMQEHINTLNAFIKDSTHEINTPLSIILMSIETLGREQLNHSQRQKIERIRLASKSLSHLYKDLVAYNFPHSIDNVCENIALHELLSERLEYFAPFFEQKSLQVVHKIESAFLNASREKMGCVLDNLLSNAIKYNKKGGIIHIELKDGELVISDSGCGIAPLDMQRIFERYVRVNHAAGGFGIGLTLVKRICDEYHIKLEVQSRENKGSSFILKWQK